MTEKVKTVRAIFCYPIFNFAGTLVIGLRFGEKSGWEAPKETIQSWRSQVFNSPLPCQYNTCPIELSFIIKEGFRVKQTEVWLLRMNQKSYENTLEHVRNSIIENILKNQCITHIKHLMISWSKGHCNWKSHVTWLMHDCTTVKTLIICLVFL